MAALLVLAACTAPSESAPEPSSDLGTPATPPERFAFGAPVDEARIALWDIDVRPDGVGLPPGSGTMAQGEAVYQRTCAACHGATGTEGPNNELVGNEPWGEWPGARNVGSYWPYATTLFDYIRRAMPQNAPGSLTADETYAVIAWILARSEIIPADAVMDATTLPQVVMPARDRFVPDDRTGGPVVR